MKKLLFGLFLIATIIPCVGQVPYFQQYFLLRKNEAVQINTIIQQKNGYMWFGTSKGLFSFEGKNQQRYTKKQGLPHEGVTALAEDSLGRIWMGHEDGHISFIAKAGVETFNPQEGSSTKAISDILFDSKGNLWFSTFNDGLYYYTGNRLYRVDDAEGLPDLYIYDLAEDAQGRIWAGTDGGAAVCTLQKDKISINVLDYNDGLPDNIIRKIFPETDHTVLLGTEDAGIIRYNLNTKKIEPLWNHPWVYGQVSDFEVKNEKVWIACPQKGLLIYNQITKEENLFTPDQNPNLLSIRILERDTEGNIWVGTKSKISRTVGDGLQFLEQPVTGGNSNILAVTVDHQNHIWFSNSDGLFKRKLNEDQAIQKPLANSPFKKYTVISLYTDSKGYVWAGLYGEGVLRINPHTGKIRYLNKELRNGNVLSIAGQDNTVWLGTLGGSSKITFDQTEELTITNYSSGDGLASDFIYQVFIENNRIWFATDGKGLAMLNRNGFHHYEKGIPSAVVYGMAQDAKQRLWINVQGHGLYIFDGRKFSVCDSTLVLRDKNIHCLVADKDGNIVVMHDVGMDIIDVRRNKMIYLGEEVGIRDKVANLNAVGKDRDGNIYFGTNGGIIKYAGERGFLVNKPRPQLKDVFVFDSLVDLTTTPTLAYDENNITLNYTGVWYKNPEGLHYAYKLDNYDRDWITTRNQEVTYSRLPPGSYTFKVRVAESLDFNDATEAKLSFSIRPPIWQTIPFYMFSLAAVVATVFVVVKSRERKLRRYNDLLEKKVQLRTREIQMQNEEIQAQNEEISSQSEEILRINENLEEIVQERTRELERKNKALEEYAFINAHKLRSPVATILGLINLFSKTKLDHEGVEINQRLQSTAAELDCIVASITKAIERGERKIPKLKDDD
ncbi:two-component regulator propeller domain-containing protein [Chryseolinea sp. H1M3-3]|uniref:ligand-binding sensor domain-containing protein n=1 Tax=Chryseolinea sp. H1M3-3 TaxID=3034144 RepID=UPI0023EA91FA|nr:two-component regulator propeller domain-containing protein [Chryseolinea sp. H1M3-3]